MGEKLLDIEVPNYPNHDMTGWYLTSDFSGEAIDLSTYTLSGPVTIYARWEQIVTLIFEWNYGELGVYGWSIGYLGGTIDYVPADPENENYTFTGWYTGKACLEDQLVDFSSYLLTGDATLYAGWTADVFEITYDLQGGENAASNPTSYTVESAEITLTAPTREGYTFEGWTGTGIDEAQTEVVIATGTTGALAFTANWEATTYTITYDLVRGTLTGTIPATYTIESEDIVLATPQKDGYVFEGWIGTDLTDAEMIVTIPTGSVGDRTYTATWSTTDASAAIVDNAIEALEGDYTFELDEFTGGTDENSSVYQTARDALDTDEDTRDYAEEITLTLELNEEGVVNPVENETGYIWTYTATISYTDDEGTTLEREGIVTATVNKRMPTVTAPAASDLYYGETLSMSTLSGGSAVFGETAVEGSFAWTDGTVVPTAADNGNAIYSVTFTPADTATYAVVTVDAAVETQTGVNVNIENADSRYYIAATTQTDGSYTLTDADTGADLTDVLTLAGGEYHFSQTKAETNVDVTFSGYSLTDTATLSGGMVPKYTLVNTTTNETIDIDTGTTSTARADILKVPFEDTDCTTLMVTLPTATAIYGYQLTNDMLSGGEVTVTYNYTYYRESVTVDGGWTWTDTSQTPDEVEEKTYSVTFTPTDSANYGMGTKDVTVNVAKQPVDAPTIASKTYDGEWNPTEYPTSDLYKVTGYKGGYQAGEYYFRLKLLDPDHYTWSESAREEGTLDADDETILTVTYTVYKVDLEVDVSGATVTPLAYGQWLKYDKGTDIGMANGMISGTSVKFNGETVPGQWVWDSKSITSAQPLSVNDNGYQVTAVFKPDDGNLAASINTASATFTVKVLQVTPDVSDVTVRGSELLQWESITLADSTLTADKDAVNPNDDSITVSGTWTWEDPERIPIMGEDETFTVIFTPTDTVNYKTVISTATVPMTDKLTITFSSEGITTTDLDTMQLYDYDTWNSATPSATTYVLSEKPKKPISIGLYMDLEYYKSGVYDLYSIVSMTMTYGAKSYMENLSDPITYQNRLGFNYFDNIVVIAVETVEGSDNRICLWMTFDLSKLQLTESTLNVHFILEYLGGSNSLSVASASSGVALSAVAGTDALTVGSTLTDETDQTDEAENATESADADTDQSGGTVTETTGNGESSSGLAEADSGESGGMTQSTESETETQTEAATDAQTSTEAQTEAATETAVETQ